MFSILSARSGFSTGRRFARISLYIVTIISKFPVCVLYTSTFLKRREALSGTDTSRRPKYLTSLKSLTRVGSKFTLTNPSPGLA